MDQDGEPPGSASDSPDPATLSRNWSELLQEIRVTQTGVQVLTGFLLTVPFSARFSTLNQVQRTTYLAVLTCAVLSTAFFLAPVAFHRMLFRRRRRELIVDVAHRCARIGLVTLGLTSAGAIFLVFDIVAGSTAGLVSLGACLVGLLALWGLLPPWLDRRDPRPRNPPPAAWEGHEDGHRD